MSIFNGLFDNFSRNGSTKGNLGDFQHASRLYVANNMRLAPKVKFLYHVVLNINQNIAYNPLNTNVLKREVNILAKNVDLPQFRINTNTVNQYNRKKIIQTGVEYQPINIEYHDDNAGLTTLLWEVYFRYYYNDSNYTDKNPDGSPSPEPPLSYQRVAGGLNRSYGTSEDNGFRYGLDRSNKRDPFFRSIQVFQLAPQGTKSTFTSFTLINPIIESMQHDNMDQSVSEFVTNRLTISYESVQYARGYTSVGNSPAGFGEDHYDTIPSPNGSLVGNVSNATTIAGLNNSDAEAKRANIYNSSGISQSQTQSPIRANTQRNLNTGFSNPSSSRGIIGTVNNIANTANTISNVVNFANNVFPTATRNITQTISRLINF